MDPEILDSGASSAAPSGAEGAPAAPGTAAVPPSPALTAPAEPLVSEVPSLIEGFSVEDPIAAAAKKPAPDTAPKLAEPAKKEGDPAKPAAVDPAKAAAEAKPADPKAATPVVEAAISYDGLKLPEGAAADKEKMGAFTALAGEDKISAERAQKYLDLYTDATQKFAAAYVESALREQHKAFNDMRQTWATNWKADSQLGGAGFETASGAVARMRDLLVSNSPRGTDQYEKDWASFREFSRITGGGDHPALGRILHNAARLFDEAAQPPPNPQPPKDIGKAPGSGGLRGMYRKGNGAQAG